MAEKSLLLQLVGDLPLFKIVDFLIENKGLDFTKKDIIEGADLSRSTLFNYWGELEKRSIVRVTRTFGKTKLYTLNTSNPIVKKLLELEATVIRQTMESVAPKQELVASA